MFMLSTNQGFGVVLHRVIKLRSGEVLPAVNLGLAFPVRIPHKTNRRSSRQTKRK
jgi:hypothetical protein